MRREWISRAMASRSRASDSSSTFNAARRSYWEISVVQLNTGTSYQGKLRDPGRDEDVRTLHRKHLPRRSRHIRQRILDSLRHLPQHLVQPVLRLDRPFHGDRVEVGEDASVVEEAFGEDAEHATDRDKAGDDGGAGGRLGEHPLGGYEVVVGRFGKGGDALEVVNQHRGTGDGAGSENQRGHSDVAKFDKRSSTSEDSLVARIELPEDPSPQLNLDRVQPQGIRLGVTVHPHREGELNRLAKACTGCVSESAGGKCQRWRNADTKGDLH